MNLLILTKQVRVTRGVVKKMEMQTPAEEEDYHQGKGIKSKSVIWILDINPN